MMKIIDKRGDRDATREMDSGTDRNHGDDPGTARVGDTSAQPPVARDGGIAGEGGQAEDVPSRQPEAQQNLRSAVCEYVLGIVVTCGHCGEQQFHSSPQFVQGALMNAGFQGPCPKCKGAMVMKPKQSVILVPQEQMRSILNRGQRRAHEAVLRKGGNGRV